MLVRRAGGCYWYESVRVAGRVRRAYVCSGEEALAASRHRDEERLSRQAARDEALLEEQRHELLQTTGVLLRGQLSERAALGHGQEFFAVEN